MSSPEVPPYLSIRLRGTEKPVEFKSAVDVATWLENEIAFWRAIQERFPQHEEIGTLCGKSRNNIQKFVNRFREVASISALPAGLGSEVETFFQNELLHSSTREMRCILDVVRKFEPAVVYHALVYVMEDSLKDQRNLRGVEAGRIVGMMISEGVPFHGDFGGIELLHATWETKHRELGEELKSLKETSAASLARLESDYKQIRAIDEPAAYWSKKKNRHGWLTAGSLILAIAVATYGGMRILKAGTDARNDAIQYMQANDAEKYLLPTYALPVVLGAIGFLWLLRILVRLFLTQLHLWTDAAERVVMVNTYLALLVGKGVLAGKTPFGDEQLTIILTQLFRHGSTGLFKDDASPQMPLDVLVREGASKQKE